MWWGRFEIAEMAVMRRSLPRSVSSSGRSARDGAIRLTEVFPTDESLESVFAYLVSGTSAGVRR